MKNYRFGIVGLALCMVLSLLLITSCSPSAQQTSKWKKVGRYENQRIGLSVEYDAEKLNQAVPPMGTFVFMRQSTRQYPMMAVSAGPYPQGTDLKETGPMIAAQIPNLVPGSQVYDVYNEKMIKLSDDTEVNYFEMKWNNAGVELKTVFVVAQKDDYLITVSVSDKVENPVEASAAMVKTLKFDIEVDEEALKATGFGKDGKFTRTNSPAFTLAYPKEFRNLPMIAGLIFRAGIPQGSPSVEISILPLVSKGDIEIQLKGMATRYASLLGAVGSDIKILSNEKIDHYQGFPAYQFQIVWKYQGQIPLTSVVHVIAKENQAIHLAGHTVYEPEDILDIFKTINLNP